MLTILIPLLMSVAVSASESVQGQFTISGPVTKESLKRFKEAGGKYVIDVRDMNEKGDCGEAIVATKLGLKFHMAPMPKTAPVTAETIARVEDIVREAKGGKVLVYCSTGVRAAAWFAVHLARVEKRAPEDAIAVARAAGLKSAVIEEEVREFLESADSRTRTPGSPSP